MRGSVDLCGMVQNVAAIIQNQGQYDFPCCEADDEVRTACLCGVTVYVENGYVVRICAHDMDIVLNSYFHRTANDRAATSINSYSHYTFLKGDLGELSGWHNRLTRFQTVFRRHQAAESLPATGQGTA